MNFYILFFSALSTLTTAKCPARNPAFTTTSSAYVPTTTTTSSTGTTTVVVTTTTTSTSATNNSQLPPPGTTNPQAGDAADSKGVISQDTSGSDNQVTLAELATHNLVTDCWVIFQSNVLDLTEWAMPGGHPGGSAPYQDICGTRRFEDALLAMHGTSYDVRIFNVTTNVGQFVG